jgi:hypothetical protein
MVRVGGGPNLLARRPPPQHPTPPEGREGFGGAAQLYAVRLPAVCRALKKSRWPRTLTEQESGVSAGPTATGGATGTVALLESDTASAYFPRPYDWFRWLIERARAGPASSPGPPRRKAPSTARGLGGSLAVPGYRNSIPKASRGLVSGDAYELRKTPPPFHSFGSYRIFHGRGHYPWLRALTVAAPPLPLAG